jgi:hypothetical protein
MAITKKALSIRASKEKAETTKKKRTHSRIISTWLKALRGQLPTKYKKVTGSLCKVTSTGKVKGHCCLGVLSDLAAKAGIIDMPDFSEITTLVMTQVFGTMVAVLSCPSPFCIGPV